MLAAAARTRQLPPEVTTHARPRSARTRARMPWIPWLSGVVATAAVVIAVLFGFAQAHTQQELNQARAQNQAIALVLSAPQVKLLTQTTTEGGVATVVLAADRHELVVTTTGLPALPAGHVYQLWLIGKKGAVSAGLLPPASSSGLTKPVLASGVVKGDSLGLTVEPAPGSSQAHHHAHPGPAPARLSPRTRQKARSTDCLVCLRGTRLNGIRRHCGRDGVVAGLDRDPASPGSSSVTGAPKVVRRVRCGVDRSVLKPRFQHPLVCWKPSFMTLRRDQPGLRLGREKPR